MSWLPFFPQGPRGSIIRPITRDRSRLTQNLTGNISR
jgi:hypothetical protein